MILELPLTQFRIAVTVTLLLTAFACGYSSTEAQEPPTPPPQATTPDAASSVKTNEPMPLPSGKADADAVAAGLKHFRQEEWTLAVEHFTEAINQSPKDPSGYWFRAQSHERLGNTAEARADYGSVVELVDAPKEVPALRARGYALIEIGRYDDAIVDLSAALSLSANDAESLMLLGKACERKGDLDSALKFYTQLLEIAPKFADAALRRGNVYVRLGRYREGLSDQKRAARLTGITSGDFLYKDGDNGALYRFIFVPPGRYWIGYDEDQRVAVAGEARQLLFGHNATPIQEVQLREGFFILDREITVGQFESVIDVPLNQSQVTTTTGEQALQLGVDEARDSEQKGEPKEDNSPARPQTNVSWIDAMRFCLAMQDRLGLVVRLPTEVEWECAARRHRDWLYPWGLKRGESFPAWSNRPNEGPRSLNLEDSLDVTPSGIHDLAGNVSEWCFDEYHNSLFGEMTPLHSYVPITLRGFNTTRQRSRTAARSKDADTFLRECEGSRRSFRGGSYNDTVFNCQVPVRRAMNASEGSLTIGFRPVLLMRFAK